LLREVVFHLRKSNTSKNINSLMAGQQQWHNHAPADRVQDLILLIHRYREMVMLQQALVVLLAWVASLALELN
jgi:hypothetical protein